MQNPPVNTTLALFCPRRSCNCYQSTENKITKDGTYTTKSDPEPRQMLYCHGGKHRFSETGYSDLFGKHGSFKEYEQTAKLSCYGLSTDAIADVLQKDQRTIEHWKQAIGKKGGQFHTSLRIRINNENTKFIKKYEHNTPAMKMGLTNSPLNWRYLIGVPIPYN